MNNTVYAVKYPEKENEAIKLFKEKEEAKKYFYETATDIILDSFEEIIVPHFESKIKETLSDIYEEISDFCCEVEEFDQCIDFNDFDDDEDIDAPLKRKGKKLLKKINEKFKVAKMPIILSDKDFDTAEDYLYKFGDLLSEELDFFTLAELIYGNDQLFVEYVETFIGEIEIDDTKISIKLNVSNYKTISLFETQKEE